jgi:predicted SprT family Zn-dependent metalloprotease
MASAYDSVRAIVHKYEVVNTLKCPEHAIFGYNCGHCSEGYAQYARIPDASVFTCDSCGRENMVRNPSRIFSAK